MAGVSFGGASSLEAPAVSEAMAFSAAFFFFFPDFGFADVFSSVRTSVSRKINCMEIIMYLKQLTTGGYNSSFGYWAIIMSDW